MALSPNTEPRAEKLRALADVYGIAVRERIEDCENSAEEDLLLHLFHGDPGDDAEPISRWCAVTASGEYTYLYPRYETRAEAEAKTVEYPDDDIYSESPVAVVDLDGEGEAGTVYRLKKLIAVFG